MDPVSRFSPVFCAFLPLRGRDPYEPLTGFSALPFSPVFFLLFGAVGPRDFSSCFASSGVDHLPSADHVQPPRLAPLDHEVPVYLGLPFRGRPAFTFAARSVPLTPGCRGSLLDPFVYHGDPLGKGPQLMSARRTRNLFFPPGNARSYPSLPLFVYVFHERPAIFFFF